MPIDLDDGSNTVRTPVLKRTKIGEKYIGALVDITRRDVLKDGQPVYKDNGKPRQELVVTLVTMPGSDMIAGLGDYSAIAEEGEVVRTILRGGGYGAWIEASNNLKGRVVGDIVTLTSDYGQAYDANGRPTGDRLTTQQEINNVPRSHALGIYGSVNIRRATGDDTKWVELAEAAHAGNKAPTPVPDYADDEVPF